MSAPIEAEVGILGAGPAGVAAAVQLGQLGIRDVVLVDRADFPRDKTCGSGISPKGIEYLKLLGVWDAVEPHCYPVYGLRLVTRSGREVYVSGGETAAAVICLRRVLDELLLKRAQALGIRFLPRFLARELIEEQGRVVGFRADDGREIRARFTLVADGAHSRFVPDRGPKEMLQAIMGWWEGVPFKPGHVEMVFDPLVLPYYGWLFPESATRVNIGICYRDGEHRKNARAMFREFLERQYASRLAGARQLGDWKGHPIVFSYAIGRLHSPGRIVLGEAGRMTHPATGEGIYQGMRTGVLAAQALRDVLRDRRSEEDAFDSFQLACQRAFLPSFWGAKLFHTVIDSPLPDWITALSQKPSVKRVVGSLMANM